MPFSIPTSHLDSLPAKRCHTHGSRASRLRPNMISVAYAIGAARAMSRFAKGDGAESSKKDCQLALSSDDYDDIGVEAGSRRRYRDTPGADPKRLQRLLSLPSADNRALGGRPAGVVAKGTPKTIAGCFRKSIVHATRTLDVLTPFTPHSELYRNFKASRCIPPEQWNLVEHLTGHGQPFLAFRPCPPNPNEE